MGHGKIRNLSLSKNEVKKLFPLNKTDKPLTNRNNTARNKKRKQQIKYDQPVSERSDIMNGIKGSKIKVNRNKSKNNEISNILKNLTSMKFTHPDRKIPDVIFDYRDLNPKQIIVNLEKERDYNLTNF